MKGDRRLEQLLNKYPDKVTVLEEAIDVNLQKEYFTQSKRLKNSLDDQSTLNQKGDLFNPDFGIEDKKVLLCRLASVKEVEAFRLLEKYKMSPDEELKSWSILAYQQSKMLMQSDLLDEKPIFISTGLGGKGLQLRYFIVVTSNDNAVFSDYQKELIKTELDYAFKKEEAELEEVSLHETYVTATGLVSLNVSVKNLLTKVVKQCNELGNFVDPSILVTNLKKLDESDICKLIEDKASKK